MFQFLFSIFFDRTEEFKGEKNRDRKREERPIDRLHCSAGRERGLVPRSLCLVMCALNQVSHRPAPGNALKIRENRKIYLLVAFPIPL